MSYDKLKTKLYENLKQLMIQCDNWEVGVWEVIKYQDYITKILEQYKQQHEAN
jgi:hypothetical protein